MPLTDRDRDILETWIQHGVPDGSGDNAADILQRFLDAYDEAWVLIETLVGGDRLTVTLTEADWRSVLTDIQAAHGEYCIPDDRCDCHVRMTRIERQWEAT